MRRLLPLVVVLLLLVSAAAHAQEWSADLDAAVGKARSERKLVVAYVRAGCGICNKPSDDFISDADAREGVKHAYANAILVRADSNDRRSALMNAFLEYPVTLPAIFVADPAGLPVASWNAFDSHSTYAGFLTRVRQETEAILDAYDLRAAGKKPEADMTLGMATLRLGLTTRARKLFESAAAEYRKGGDKAGAQFADVYTAFTWFAYGAKSKANQMLTRITRNPENKVNAAEAWLALGSMRRIDGDRRGAVKAFREAYALAPEGSNTSRSAISGLQLLDEKPLDEKKAVPSTVRILKPPRMALTGKAEFVVESDKPMARVELFLDDKPVASIKKAPFRARIDVGPVPQMHTIKAVAFDAAGATVGEAVTTINDRVDATRVSITSPAGEKVSGQVMVEADVIVPRDRKIQKLELFFNDQPIATFAGPPFRAPYVVPEGFGYFRAVATFDDGTSAEDARIVNAAGASAAIEVQAVDFAATVTDAKGVRIRGIKANEFVIREDGAKVNATVRDAADEPVTIGIAVDTSVSMKHALLDVIEVTSRFIDIAVSEKDRLFLVTYDIQPRLTHPPSNDAASLRAKALDMRVGGGTSMYDGIVYSLQQFQGVGGKKALLVLTDGEERASTQTATDCIRLAKATGIPIYFVVPPRAFGVQPRRFGNALDEMASNTGGLVFHTPPLKELPEIFARILDETQGQYLVTFVSPKSSRSREWRTLTVEVPGRKDAQVRTISGYYAK